MSLDVSAGGAFVAGLLSFASPCVLPLVPPYLAYMGGVSIEQLRDGERAAARGSRAAGGACVSSPASALCSWRSAPPRPGSGRR